MTSLVPGSCSAEECLEVLLDRERPTQIMIGRGRSRQHGWGAPGRKHFEVHATAPQVQVREPARRELLRKASGC